MSHDTRIGLLGAGHAVTVVSVQDDPDPATYDAVVVGSGVLAGSVYPAAGRWLTAHARGLADKPVGLFVVCLGVATRDPARLDEDIEHYVDMILGWLTAPGPR